MRSVNFKELSVLGARVYTREDFDRAIEMADALPLDRVVSHRLPITRVAEAFGLIFDARKVGKVVLLPQARGEARGDLPSPRG
jgi:threonine dehydrogenase-like Zn-dependent dehydrogenase